MWINLSLWIYSLFNRLNFFQLFKRIQPFLLDRVIPGAAVLPLLHYLSEYDNSFQCGIR